MTPYQDEAGQRVVIRTEEIRLDDRGATPLALIFHELATNAAKYGALKEPAGQVVITSQLRGPDVVMTWEERGGPPVEQPPMSSGFGANLITMSVERHLAGTINRQWDRDGLRVEIVTPERNLHRGSTN